MRNSESKICTVLTIAGSDPIGETGIQSDLKTISAFGLYGMSVITALTAQNTQGIQSVNPVAPEIVAAQLDSIFSDVMPDCVKIGMLAEEEIVEVVAEKLRQYQPKLVVLDPVMVSARGQELLSEAGRRLMVEKLFPMVTVLTPNLPEVKELMKMADEKKGTKTETSDRKEMAEHISSLFGDEMDKKHAILIKGGHMPGNEADDYLYWFCHFSGRDKNSIVVPQETTQGRKVVEFSFTAQRIDNPNTRGKGGTLSAAIACGLAKRRTVETSVREAKEYITGAIRGGLSIGKGTGPLDHFWKMTI
jgi:hydroxymethylpyrimidine/phosphomethylpyrimidine kinase